MKYLILKNGSYAVGKYVPEGATIIDKPRPTSAHSWNGSKWVFDGFSDEESMNVLRVQRNMKLAETDWMANSDVIMSDAWKKYRKDLRDLPSSAKPKLDENRQLTNVTWPEKPE